LFSVFFLFFLKKKKKNQTIRYVDPNLTKTDQIVNLKK